MNRSCYWYRWVAPIWYYIILFLFLGLSSYGNSYGQTIDDFKENITKGEYYKVLDGLRAMRSVSSDTMQRVGKQVSQAFNVRGDTQGEIIVGRFLADCFVKDGAFSDAGSMYASLAEKALQCNDSLMWNKLREDVANVYIDMGEADSALKIYQKVRVMRERWRNDTLLSMVYHNIGLAFDISGNYDSALSYYKQSLQIDMRLGDSLGVANTLNNMGVVYGDKGVHDKALIYYLRVLRIMQQGGNVETLCDVYNNIGSVYFRWNDWIRAEKYFLKSLKCEQLRGDKQGELTSLNNIGSIYQEQGRYVDADSVFKLAYKLASLMEDEVLLGYIQINLGGIELLQGNLESAFSWLNKAEKYVSKSNIPEMKNVLWGALGNYYVLIKDYPKAIAYFNNIRFFTDAEVSIETHMDALKGLTNSYNLIGNRKLAYETQYEYYKLYKEYYALHKLEVVNELKYVYEIENQNTQLGLLEKNRVSQQLMIDENRGILFQRRWFLTVLSLIGVILLALMLFFYKQIIRKGKVMALLSEQNKKLEEYNNDLVGLRQKAVEAEAQKNAFLANVSHEIRTPMNAVLGFSSLALEEGISDEDRKYYFDVVSGNVKHLIGVMEEILAYADLESGNVEIVIEPCNVNKMLYSVGVFADLEKSRLNKEDIDLIIEKGDGRTEVVIDTDVEKFKRLLLILVGNALKYTEQGLIRFGYQYDGGEEIEFFVEDTGIGMSGEEMEIIFEKFRQVDESHTRKYSGVGLGLSIAKKIVGILEGTLWAESSYGEGSAFYFNLPLKMKRR